MLYCFFYWFFFDDQTPLNILLESVTTIGKSAIYKNPRIYLFIWRIFLEIRILPQKFERLPSLVYSGVAIFSNLNILYVSMVPYFRLFIGGLEIWKHGTKYLGSAKNRGIWDGFFKKTLLPRRNRLWSPQIRRQI